MKKFFKALSVTAFTALLLCGCGESNENPSSYYQPVITMPTEKTGTDITTTITECTTLKPFSQITAISKMTFMEITEIKANGMTGSGGITPWGSSETTVREETGSETTVTETETEIKTDASQETKTEKLKP